MIIKTKKSTYHAEQWPERRGAPWRVQRVTLTEVGFRYWYEGEAWFGRAKSARDAVRQAEPIIA